MVHRILLVANKTLGGDELTAIVRDRVAAQGATELGIVAPATAPPDPWALATESAGFLRQPSERSGAELAGQRLEDATYRFRDLGIPVGGEVSDEDPFTAVSDVLSRRQFDEVIVSTLPTAVSHWLRADLPNRVHRKFGIPVTTVTSRGR